MKALFFIAGLPRSGSTLLCNLLCQNQKVQATPTSGLLDTLSLVKNNWAKLPQHQAQKPDNERLRVILKAMTLAYHSSIEKPIVADKCRGWTGHIEMMEWVLGAQMKILVPIRDIRDVLSSLELLYRKQSAYAMMAPEAQNAAQFSTLQGRCDYWMSANQLVGNPLNKIRDCIQRGFRDRIFPIPFEQLTNNPTETMAGVWKFLGVPDCKHDFENVEPVCAEDDLPYGWNVDLHTTRTKVEPIPPRYPQVLGALAKRYEIMI